jgi:glycosyltransferase involved in cell wall biosynthesis
MISPLRVVINSPSPDTLTETFIHAHYECLPFAIISLFRRRVPYTTGDGHWIGLAPALLRNAADALKFTVLSKAAQAWGDRRVGAWLRDQRPDVVLAEYGPLGATLRRACELAGVPLVVMFHGYDAYHLHCLQQFQKSYHDLFESAAAVVAVSPAMAQQLISIGCPPEKLSVNPYGVCPQRFQGATPSAAGPEFLAVGRLIEKKAPQHTIAAFARVCDSVPSARLTILGSGPMEYQCRQLVDTLGIGAYVRFVGAQPTDVVQAWLRQSRAFVQHSVTASCGDSEGTPVAILEALMSGLPVVSTRHAGIPDVVRHGETGFLCEEHDVEMMAEYLLQLATDSSLADRLGLAARDHALVHYSIDRHIQDLAVTLRAAALVKTL